MRFPNIRRRLSTVAAATALGAGLLVAAPAPQANASPWNCQFWQQGSERAVLCHSGTGEFRVGVHCIAWHGASSWYSYGPWMRVTEGKPSLAGCGWTDRIGASFMQGRG